MGALGSLVAAAVLAAMACAAEQPAESWSAEKRMELSAGRANVAEFDLDGALVNSSHTVVVRTSFVKRYGDGNGDAPTVTFDALNGNQTVSWTMSAAAPAGSALLCFDSARRGKARVTVVARTAAEGTVVAVSLVRTSIQLRFGEEVEAAVSPGRPLTVLVDPVTDEAVSNRDRYVLKMRSADGGASAGVCVVVAAYAGVCPFRDREDSVRTADMWFTALGKGAMTIRFGKSSAKLTGKLISSI